MAVVVQSAVVEVELASGQVVQRYDNVGMNCHGLVMWRGVFVLLSSKETSLITLNRSTKEITYIWSVCIDLLFTALDMLCVLWVHAWGQLAPRKCRGWVMRTA